MMEMPVGHICNPTETIVWRCSSTQDARHMGLKLKQKKTGCTDSFVVWSVGHQFGWAVCMVSHFHDLCLVRVESWMECSRFCGILWSLLSPFIWTSGLWCRVVKPIHAESSAWTWWAPKEANSCCGNTVAQRSLFGAGQTFELSNQQQDEQHL